MQGRELFANTPIKEYFNLKNELQIDFTNHVVLKLRETGDNQELYKFLTCENKKLGLGGLKEAINYEDVVRTEEERKIARKLQGFLKY